MDRTAALSAAEALAATPFFAGLTSVELARLVPELEEREIAIGEAIFREGDPADGLYLIRSGTAAVVTHGGGESQIVAVLEAPSYVGEMALLSDEPRSADVVALTPDCIWRMPRERFDALVSRDTRLPLRLAVEMTRRLAETTRKLSASRDAAVAVARATYASLAPPAQELLRCAAVLPEVNREALRALLGASAVTAMIESLLQETAFFRPADRPGWFRFAQESVREFLLSELLDHVGAAGLHEWRCRAADALLAAGGAVGDALDLFYAAGDWSRLARELEWHGTALVEPMPDRVE